MTQKLVLTAEHKARELIHGIMLVTCCLQRTEATPVERKQWNRRAATSRRSLAALCAGGLNRNFRNAPAGLTAQAGQP